MKKGKRFTAAVSKIEREREYSIDEAIKLVKENATAKFDETIETAVWLSVDPRQADQQVRGTVVLPHGTGKKVTVLVLTKTKYKEAEAAGADHVGFDEYVTKIKAGWTEVDVIIATPDAMSEVGKLGKILGPRGLMPNPKSGTVTMDVENAIKEVKAGRVEFRVDKGAVIHTRIGKASFSEAQLVENFTAFMATIHRLRPSTAKGHYIKSVTLSSTMGPGVKLDRLRV